MTEAVVSSVVSQLANLVTDEAVFLGGMRDQVEWVTRQLHSLRVFLIDADSRRRRGDARMESWITEMRGVAYEMEDIIDTINYVGERRHQIRRGFMGSISRYSHKPRELITLHKIGSRIEQIKVNIQSISDRRDRYGIANLGESSAVDESLGSLRQFSPLFLDDSTDVIGFDDDKEKLVKLVVDPEIKRRSVISIVGMGGLGKTTLARKVYNDPEIKEHFDTFAWVSVSQEYRVIQLVKDIMKKVMGIRRKKETTAGITVEDLEQMGEEEAREKLRDFLRGRKYLVVMDDVWTVDVWGEMRGFFPNENNGSRILLTTRKMEVAKHAESFFPPHELQLLNNEDSLELFRKKAFPAPNQDVPAELRDLVPQLAERCGGLPLALAVLGGLLSTKDRNYDTWSKVAQSMNSEHRGHGQEDFNIVGLSYHDLPYQLKPCFLYITAFPEDSVISASKLVRLFIAEGFIPQQEGWTMEDTARDWLDELVRRSMIQVVERTGVRRRVKSIRIHKMLCDFGLSEAKKDGFLHVCSGEIEPTAAISDGTSSHRAAFHDRINEEVVVSSPHLRTLLGLNLVFINAGRFLHGLNLLRVLDLEGASNLKKLPIQIGNMIHLRYLGLRGTGLDKLPSTIGHLLFLQTLDVRGTEIKWLPKSFWRIWTLRHLYIHTFMLLSTPMAVDRNNLQTLQVMDHPYLVRTTTTPTQDARYKMRDIKCLKSALQKSGASASGDVPDYTQNARYKMLKRSLGMALQDSLASLTLNFFSYPIPGDVIFAKARGFQRLHSLNLEGRLLFKGHQLPDSSQFPPNLAKLILSFSWLEQDPMPVLEKLPNLRLLALKFDAYIGESMSCSAGHFLRLQHLTLHNLFDLEEWRVDVGAMPCLTHLTINWCRTLKMLPEGLQHVRELKLINMPPEFNGRVRNAEWYKVRRMPSTIFEAEK